MILAHKNIFDISVMLDEETVIYPGDTFFAREVIVNLEEGPYTLSKLTMSAHFGTHIDMPSHFIKGGAAIEDFSASRFILPARVIEILSVDAVRPADVVDIGIRAGEAILFKTRNSESGICAGKCSSGRFTGDYVYIAPGAARVCAESGAALVGLDYVTIEKYGDEDFKAHRELLGRGVLVLEGIDLRGIVPGEYLLICLPLKIRGCEASPVRAVLAAGVAPPASRGNS
jgi:arylformamidase